MQQFSLHLRRYFFVALGPLAAFIVMAIPLQMHMPLSRYQHYGIAIFVWGICYILQLIWSYKKILFWSRLSYLMTGVYLISAGLVFYSNPWLDVSQDLITSGMRGVRRVLGLSYALLTLPILMSWYMSYMQERKAFFNKSAGDD